MKRLVLIPREAGKRYGYMEILKAEKRERLREKIKTAIWIIIAIGCIVLSGFQPRVSQADSINEKPSSVTAEAVVTAEMEEIPEEQVLNNTAQINEPYHGDLRTVTAYTSEPEQTDATPCESANGMNICALYAEGTNLCAANWVPFGTILTIQGLGDCVVVDRMSSRFPDRVDWYFGMDTERALQFGIQHLFIQWK